jgi:cytoskeletal protein CcmA (bactofilin family)
MTPTIIGAEIVIEGDLTSDEDVHIDGQVQGRVTSRGSVELGASGVVHSEVKARTVSLAGTVSASVTASERVDLLAGGRLTGDVKAPRLTIADGATFRGKVDMEG